MFIKKFVITILSAFALMVGLITPAAAAGTTEGEFSFTVVGTDYDYDNAVFSIENSKTIKVGAAEQVTWEVENSTATISPKLIKAAPRIHTKCTNANRRTQSQQIYRLTHHATVVIVLPGSCLWNRGRHDNIMMGFKWQVKSPAILVGDRQHRYRHGFSLVRNMSQVADDEEVVGKVNVMGRTWLIVRKCRNFIGGPVDVYVPNAVQLHYAQDVKKSGKAVATSHVDGTVTFNITCPNGANFNTTVHTWADGRGEAEIEYTERTRVSVLDAHKAKLVLDSHGNGEASATSSAGSSITVSGTCGNNPQPTYDAPSANVTPVACVNPGQLRDAIVTVYNPNGITDTAQVTYRGQLYNKPIAAHSSVAFTFPNQGQGSYTGTALLVSANRSVSFTVNVEACPPPTYQPPSGVINEVNDTVAYNGRPVGFTLTGVPGETLEVVAYAKHGGSITVGKTQSIKLDSKGNATGSLTFTAGEVPMSNLVYEVDGRTYTIGAGHDVIWLQVRDVRGKTVWVKSNDFEIRGVPPQSE